MTLEPIRLGEFFSGPGGLAQGAFNASLDDLVSKKIRLQHEWAFDIDPDSCATYIGNIDGASSESVFTQDVREFQSPGKARELPDIDGFAFGFPCNDFSIVGDYKGIHGEFGGLYKSGVQVLQEKQPKWFVAENVGGIRGANGGKAFRVILNEMQESGYIITPHLYKFEEYGVPQARHRVIIVGIRDDLAHQGIKFRVPKITHTKPELAETLGLKPYVTAGDALNRPYKEGVKHRESSKLTDRVRDRLFYIDPGENAFEAAHKMPANLRLKVKGAFISQIYKRLREDQPAYTVTGSGGGGTHMYHWSEPRALTNRERARLQTFDDKFTFEGKRESIRKQIGMAVPVKGAEVIFLALFQSLLGQTYENIRPNLDNLLDRQ